MGNRPATIDELREFCRDNNLPPDKLRTYIGIDYQGPKAFGIYYDGDLGVYVVYKNKADGSRSIRYSGPDEATAVGVLYDKIVERVSQQKHNNQIKNDKTGNPLMDHIVLCSFVIAIVFVVAVGIMDSMSPERGYYRYGNDTYYYQQGGWYRYDDSDWCETEDVPFDEYEDYYEDYEYDNSYNASDFSQTPYYVEYSDDDDDYSWDSDDSWDSSFDDWDSDW